MDHTVYSANLSNVRFQDPSGLEHCQPPTSWSSSSDFAMIDQGWRLSPEQSFALPLGFHDLPGTDHPNDDANTLLNSVSVDVELSSSKNTKVMCYHLLNSSPEFWLLLLSKTVLTYSSDASRIEPPKKPFASVRWTISIPWNNSLRNFAPSIPSCALMWSESNKLLMDCGWKGGELSSVTKAENLMKRLIKEYRPRGWRRLGLRKLSGIGCIMKIFPLESVTFIWFCHLGVPSSLLAYFASNLRSKHFLKEPLARIKWNVMKLGRELNIVKLFWLRALSVEIRLPFQSFEVLKVLGLHKQKTKVFRRVLDALWCFLVRRTGFILVPMNQSESLNYKDLLKLDWQPRDKFIKERADQILPRIGKERQTPDYRHHSAYTASSHRTVQTVSYSHLASCDRKTVYSWTWNRWCFQFQKLLWSPTQPVPRL